VGKFRIFQLPVHIPGYWLIRAYFYWDPVWYVIQSNLTNVDRLFVFQQLMHAIAMVHKMQRLALSSSNSMDIDESSKKIAAISEDGESSTPSGETTEPPLASSTMTTTTTSVVSSSTAPVAPKTGSANITTSSTSTPNNSSKNAEMPSAWASVKMATKSYTPGLTQIVKKLWNN